MSLNNYTYSSDGLHLTEGFEGCKLVAYPDQVNVWTIGWGHTKNVSAGDTCGPEQAEAYLAEDIKACADAVNAHVTIKLKQNQFDALVDYAFNLGIGALEHSTLWGKLNRGDFKSAALEFPKWDMAGGKHVAGLFRRRNAEKSLFEKE